MIGKLLISFACFSISLSTLDVSKAKLKLKWVPLHSKRIDQYPRYLLSDVLFKTRKIEFFCFYPKRAQCFETSELSYIDNSQSIIEEENDANGHNDTSYFDISSIGHNDAKLEKQVPMIPKPGRKVWHLSTTNLTLHCYQRRRSRFLEKLGKKYHC